MNEEKRMYGIDLLKNFAMIMIISVHCLGEGGVLNALPRNTVQFHLIWALEVFAFCGVNCFALISGYVSEGRAFRLKNLLRLWIQVIFYSTVITSIEMFITRNFSISEWLKSFFPVSFSTYWYFTAYVGVAVLSPLIQAGINQMSVKSIRLLCAGIFMAFSVIPTLVHNDIFLTGSGYSMLWLSILYIFGMVARKCGGFTINSGFLMSGIGFLVAWGSHGVISTLFSSGSGYLITYTSPFIFLEAFGILIIFSKIKVSEWLKKILKWCTPLSFGVYLIHTHPIVFKRIISNLFAPIASHSVGLMCLEIVFGIVTIFVVCMLLDAVRSLFFSFVRVDQVCEQVEKILLNNKYLGGGNERRYS